MSTDPLPPAADTFIATYFSSPGSIKVSKDEQQVIDSAKRYVTDRMPRMKYILGLGLDFSALAEQIAMVDPTLSTFDASRDEAVIFRAYALITTRGNRQANTLTLSVAGKDFGIRRIEEHVRKMFYAMDRPTYPSAYVYNTGQWHKYKELLVMAFQLSSSGRRLLAEALIRTGLKLLPKNSFFSRATPRIFVFPEIIADYPRSGSNENGGLVFQAIAYGYFKADRPHLSVVGSGVRTGSSRQQRIGDIDCYGGLDLELSVEVKDIEIDSTNMERELGQFISDVAERSVPGAVFVRSIASDCRERLRDTGITVIDDPLLQQLVELWDWPKQNAAVTAMLHFLAHIEQNPTAVHRLLAFIAEHDDSHDSLAYAVDPKLSSS